MTQLWFVFDPCDDWYTRAFLNGELLRGLSLPAADCDACGRITYGSTIACECPTEIRAEIQALGEGYAALPLKDFRARANHWEAVLREHGVIAKLVPGESFRPTRWRLQSVPRFDVFWPLLGTVVSERFRALLAWSRVVGVSFEPLALDMIGLAEPTEMPLIPTGGEFDDKSYENIEHLRDPKSCGEFFRLRFEFTTESTEPGVVENCSVCGTSNWHLVNVPQPERDRLLNDQSLPLKYIPDADLFWSHVFTGGFVIRDWVRKIIPSEYFTNCGVKPIRVLDA